jgi:uncharacterized protein YxjI
VPSYFLRQRLLSIGRNYDIRDAAGAVVFKARQNPLGLARYAIRDMRTGEVTLARDIWFSLSVYMRVQRGGRTLANIRKEFVSSTREKYLIDIPGQPTLEARGTFHVSYHIERNRQSIATIRKASPALRTEYQVDIIDGEDDAFLLAIAFGLDRLVYNSDGD